MLVSGRYPTQNSRFDRLKIDAWKILLLPKFLGRKTIFSEKLCFVRNSRGWMFHLNIPGIRWDPTNFGNLDTFASRLPLDAFPLGTGHLPTQHISGKNFCSTCDYPRSDQFPNWDVYQIMAFFRHQQAGLLKQAIIMLP